MMQLKRRVIDEAVQIHFLERDLDISHSSDNPFDHFLWVFDKALLCRKDCECFATNRSKHAIHQLDCLNALCVNQQVIRPHAAINRIM
jgi:hypothetical protein